MSRHCSNVCPTALLLLEVLYRDSVKCFFLNYVGKYFENVATELS